MDDKQTTNTPPEKAVYQPPTVERDEMDRERRAVFAQCGQADDSCAFVSGGIETAS